MRITIITACFNSIATIRDAIESVRRQELPPGVELEHLIVDGGSADGTVEEVKSYELRVRREGQTGFSFKWVSERDKGLYDAINKGIRMATGDVIGILNADDVLASDDTIARVAGAFGESKNEEGRRKKCGEVDAVYADVRFVRSGESVEALRAAKTVRYCTGRYFRNWMFRFATFPAHPSTFVRRECFEKHGLYSLDYRICADFEMMLRLFYKNRIRTRYLPVCTTIMRLGGLSTGGLKANIQINREDLRALKAHGVWSCLPLVYLKYIAKVWGFVRGFRV